VRTKRRRRDRDASNAIFHATGKRIRTLPVTPDKLCEGAPGRAPPKEAK
jgi:hypothetical protein